MPLQVEEHVPVRVVIGSAGRRLYLIDWFRDAFGRLGLEGEVVVTDSDETSPAFTAGDRAVQMPPFSAEAYEQAMLDMVVALRPVLFVSINDYEIERLSQGLARRLEEHGMIVAGVPDDLVTELTDKLGMAKLLESAGVATPVTVLGSDEVGVQSLTDTHERVVVKHRWGSGSSGLNIITAVDVWETIIRAARDAPSRDGRHGADAIVVQPHLTGPEYGVDVVGTITGKRTFAGVLARRKLRMRAGETDKAVSVDAARFSCVARRIFDVFTPRGLIDADVIVADGVPHVIDINPRFGGGYPFCHLAGADVPSYYLAHAIGLSKAPEGLGECRPGVVSAKHEAVRISGTLEAWENLNDRRQRSIELD